MVRDEVIDELLPLVLMETNLRYGSFHTVKMTLFIRELALEQYFSKPTERELARLLALEAAKRDWIGIQADRMGYVDRNVPSLADIIGNKHKMLPKARNSKGFRHFPEKNCLSRLLSGFRSDHRVISNNV